MTKGNRRSCTFRKYPAAIPEPCGEIRYPVFALGGGPSTCRPASRTRECRPGFTFGLAAGMHLEPCLTSSAAPLARMQALPINERIMFMSSANTLSRAARQATRADVTDQIAREIIATETARRQQQTARLRSARLRKEAAERAAEPAARTKTQRKVAR